MKSFEQVWKSHNRKYPNLLREAQEFATAYKDFVGFEKVAIEEGLLLEGDPKKGLDYDDALMEAERIWERDPYITIEVLKAYYEELYDDLESYLRHIEGRDIWRAIRISKNTDPTTVDPLGIYWARIEEGAEAYWGWESAHIEVVFIAEAPSLSKIDIPGTIEANFVPEFGVEEKEIRLKKGVPLYLVSVILPDGEEVLVKDWRTA